MIVYVFVTDPLPLQLGHSFKNSGSSAPVPLQWGHTVLLVKYIGTSLPI